MKTCNLYYILYCLLFISCGSNKIKKQEAYFSKQEVPNYTVTKLNDSVQSIGSNFILKNNVGNWELFVSGSPAEIGSKMGLLSKDIYAFQENSLFNMVKNVIPDTKKQKYLFNFLEFYNRNISDHIIDEYKEEIFNLSRYASDDYDYLTDKYKRCLFLHGAHDIGHAFQDLMLVGCSSFAVWNEKSADSNLLVGRNFDFYVNDDFAKNKIIAFVRPNKGYPFVSVTWAGMIGVTSGMNLEGITVTLNAAKSSIPLQSKTPISLVAREILQYAKTIDEAILIAKKREVFVSESILVTSGNENKAVILEMSPNQFSVYDQPNSSEIICSNHFQSETYLLDERNIAEINESHSNYRFKKMQNEIQEKNKISPEDAVTILRDQTGLNKESIGLGNEKALNQLMAHHSVVFKPKSKIIWVSSQPYQLGSFTAYDLNEVFSMNQNLEPKSFAKSELIIPEDPFVHSEEFTDYEKFRVIDNHFESIINTEITLSNNDINNYIKLNPEFWKVYFRVATYYYYKKDYQKALMYFEHALNKEISSLREKKSIEAYLKKINKKLK